MGATAEKPGEVSQGAERVPFEQRLVEAVRSAARAEVVEALAMEDGSILLDLDLDGYRLAISLTGPRLVQGSLDEALSRQRSLRGRYNSIRNPEAFTVEELRERNLPLYWNERWLRAELSRLGSYTAVARTHGYPSAITIASYAKRKFGISVRKELDAKRQAVYADHDTGSYTERELAEKHGVGLATLRRWLAQKRSRKARRGKRSTS